MSESEKRLVYVIKWLKGSEKPDYQCGVIVLTDDNRFIPTPPTVFSSLDGMLVFIRTHYMNFKVSVLAMGFDENDKSVLEQFSKENQFITGKKYLVRPCGKRKDGTPYKVFLVDNHVDDIRSLKQVMLDEHFEIISMARNPKNAMKFFQANFEHIDMVFTELYLGMEDMFQAMQEMRALKPCLKIIAMSWTANKTDIEKLMPLKVDRFMIKPVVRDKLLDAIKTVTADF